MRHILLLLYFILLVSIFASCKKTESDPNCKIQITCYDVSFGATYFRNYQRSDIDTIIEKIYTPDSSFSNLTEQDLLTLPDSNDNGFVYNNLYFVEGHDYEIYIPGTNQTYKIYGLINTGKTDSVSCYEHRPTCFASLNRIITGGRYGFAQNYYTPIHLILLK